MLGFYDRFPTIIHGAFTFVSSVSLKKLERTVIEACGKLNEESMVLDDVACPTIPHCHVAFEFGIAEGNSFNYLDKQEKQKILTAIEKAPLEVMDLLCGIRYHKEQGDKKKALRFDYYLLRFRFHQKQGEMQVFHEKGPRYVTPGDLAALLVKKVNEESGRRILTES
jgi:hypothetical protein